MSRACTTGSNSWMDHLPFVLLGLRASLREDSGTAPADLVYGSALKFPGDLFCSSPELPPSASDFARHLRCVIQRSCPMPVHHHVGAGVDRSGVDRALETVSHVFLRVDAIKRPLVPPYLGPYPVLERGKRTFIILKDNKKSTVSVDRLKPAFFLDSPVQQPSVRPSSDTVGPGATLDSPAIFTNSGRVSRPVSRYQA